MWPMGSIKRTYHIRVARKHVWEALVDPRLISRWGAGPATMSARKGAKFSLAGGKVTGRNRQVTREKKLVQEWQAEGWQASSRVTISLALYRLGTHIELLHEGVSPEHTKKVTSWWENSYFGPLKRYLEDEYDYPVFNHHPGG